MTRVLAKAADQFSETVIDDEIVVMSLASGDFFSLTGSARAIWELIDGTRTRAALLADLAAAFGRTEADLAGDVDAFVAQLGSAGLLEPD
ncbi:MAG: PqqD family protein [Novosphingobium sp.]|uniref:PqqD family protein n=1 Tax=Novosphingobium sp. TaxID=1874826 RepID=UPI0032BF0166